jgi:hypothetical protein
MVTAKDAQLLTNGLRKLKCLYRMEFFSATKKNEILSFAGEWMEPENIILSEVSQAQKVKNIMFCLMCRLYTSSKCSNIFGKCHTKGRPYTGRTRETNQKLEWG